MTVHSHAGSHLPSWHNSPSRHLPHSPPQPLPPHSLPPHFGRHTHFPLLPHVSSPVHSPHWPPHPSGPHSFPLHFGSHGSTSSTPVSVKMPASGSDETSATGMMVQSPPEMEGVGSGADEHPAKPKDAPTANTKLQRSQLMNSSPPGFTPRLRCPV